VGCFLKVFFCFMPPKMSYIKPSLHYYHLKLTQSFDIITTADNPFPATSAGNWYLAFTNGLPFTECVVAVSRSPVGPSDGTIQWLINTMTVNNGGVNPVENYTLWSSMSPINTSTPFRQFPMWASEVFPIQSFPYHHPVN
jgi:hypothetical protein